jgi:tRNA A37 threonylcarbamoyladenosine dehydratase
VSVAVVGCGGVGVQVCEMLTRFGVGMLSVYDREKVTPAHMGQ